MKHRIVRQRIHERVGVRHPQKAVGRKARAHGHAIRKHHSDAELIQNLDRVATFDDAPGVGQFWCGRTNTNGVGLRFEIVDRQRVVIPIGRFTSCRGAHRMSMIVDGRNALNFLQKLGIRGRKRSVLARRKHQRRDCNA